MAEPPRKRARVDDDRLAILSSVFGFSDFRCPEQAAVVDAVMRGEDVFACLPTGAGKSLCYQLPVP
jgi:ATP-dependent DNA helicase RecQ